ncbi:cysteine hydrolase [Gilvimarinus agarilyticus]|uniref:cysteine hydrolase family protein n=1 Tax=unclassified Gilvimarinus TaxID=2642066 RepID=UPI001C09CCDE|nr:MULTISPECIES: isochorismatase family cysteine hydrolase [unclassified Gilvimarinus]MBU2887349.1 cysteine hydrolase [Gilvimarinus agarilyticus]MDO6572008.1 isochorismatase family cysteine hydrolase [Gilvimarinus sp. 2_MG-2023]MDO6746076.1 isochorismatase family cysteine hydrolase [Gilvimarinus sp. 1_MG-2023]
MNEFNALEQSTPYPWPLTGHWNSSNTAVVVIDMQRDFLADEGYFASLGENIDHLRQAIEPAQRVLQAARQEPFLIIHTRESHRPELLDLQDNKRRKALRQNSPVGSEGPLGRLLVRGEDGCDFYPGFAPHAGEIVVDKPGNSAFYATDFEHILRLKGIRNLILLGVTTDVCVSSTMRDANDRGYDCLLLSDCCGAANETLHQHTLNSLSHEGGIFGAYGPSEILINAMQSAT